MALTLCGSSAVRPSWPAARLAPGAFLIPAVSDPRRASTGRPISTRSSSALAAPEAQGKRRQLGSSGLGIGRHGFALDQIGHAEHGGLKRAPPCKTTQGPGEQGAVAKVMTTASRVASQLIQHVARDRALACAPAGAGRRAWPGAEPDVGRPKGAGQTAPAVQGRPVSASRAAGRGMGPLDAELMSLARRNSSAAGHAVIGLALHRIPE